MLHRCCFRQGGALGEVERDARQVAAQAEDVQPDRREPRLGERIHPDGPEIWAQVVYARDQEWARTVDDVLRRRTTVTIRGLDTEPVRERVAALLAERTD